MSTVPTREEFERAMLAAAVIELVAAARAVGTELGRSTTVFDGRKLMAAVRMQADLAVDLTDLLYPDTDQWRMRTAFSSALVTRKRAVPDNDKHDSSDDQPG